MTQKPRFPFLHLVTSEPHADVLSGALFELGATGVEERDQSTYVKGPGDGRVLLVASFDSHSDAEAARDELLALEGGMVEAATIEEIIGDEWRDEWKKYYEPFALTPSLVVRPPWAEYVARDEEKVRNMLLSLGREEVESMLADAEIISVEDEICGHEYRFDAGILDELFPPDGRLLH